MSTSASEILSTNPKNQSCDSIRNISPKSMASSKPVLLIHSVGGRGLSFWFAVGPSSSLREVPGAASLEPTVWRGLACVFAEAFLIEFSRTNMGWFPARVFWLWAGASPQSGTNTGSSYHAALSAGIITRAACLGSQGGNCVVKHNIKFSIPEWFTTGCIHLLKEILMESFKSALLECWGE